MSRSDLPGEANGDGPGQETRAVAERYARRAGVPAGRYSPLRPEVWQMLHERQRVMLRRLTAFGITDLASLRIAEVGCGGGGNLLEFLRLGCQPQHLFGAELLPERFAQARAVLPAGTTLWLGDATHAPLHAASQDIVLQSTVFSSLLDDAFQQQLAATMWRWVKPGGAVLWYDFTVDNPRNPDVRGVPLERVRELFPQARVTADRVTLAPPLARLACRVHPALYAVFNALPVLRTHLLAWAHKKP
ncbi:MAG TPA: class I SAM-dependent methyltransferase [Rubrivivax sp.]|nr:class I SAM-dependent methyltransferase [Rubrivivax sp.]